MKPWIKVVLLIVASVILGAFVFWYNAQPVVISFAPPLKDSVIVKLPAKNEQLIRVIEANGEALAPTYQQVVCTEFVINTLQEVTTLSKQTKKDIRIITNENLVELLEKNSPVMQGVASALVNSGQGRSIKNPSEVKPGDLVQFWDVFAGSAYGHCGIVLNLKPGKSLTMYSSHPITNGFGKQTFLWPEKVYFVRLQ